VGCGARLQSLVLRGRRTGRRGNGDTVFDQHACVGECGELHDAGDDSRAWGGHAWLIRIHHLKLRIEWLARAGQFQCRDGLTALCRSEIAECDQRR
jgi:hypothetical protein